MITTDEIDSALARLESEFLSNVNGPATKLVASVDPDAKAFGQHLSPESVQRGLHGTAAAMYVFAHTTGDAASAALIGLAHYCENRAAIESAIDEDNRVSHRRVTTDDHNVIKLAEVLHGLSSAPTIAPVDALARELAERLQAGRTAAGAWSYQLNGPTEATSLLPTAWAVLALASHGYDVRRQVKHIEEQLNGRGDQPADIAVKVFALYVLLRVARSGDKRKRRARLQAYLETLGPLLTQDIETNIEYLSGTPRVLYVRVPWQLYLIACAADLSPYRGFARRQTQNRLAAIIQQVQERGGLVYPHSGDKTSSRTNAILYETLGTIKAALEVKHLPLRPFYLWNRIVEWANSAVVRKGAQVVAAVVIVATVMDWARSDSFSWTQTGPNLVTSFLLFLLAGRRYAS